LLFFVSVDLTHTHTLSPRNNQTQIEDKLKKYHGNAEKLQLIPAQARFANGVDFTLRLNVHSSRPEQMLSVNLTTTIKVFIVYPFLLSFRPARMVLMKFPSFSFLCFRSPRWLN